MNHAYETVESRPLNHKARNRVGDLWNRQNSAIELG